MTSTACPICGTAATESVYPSYSGVCVTSDMMVLPRATIDNRHCPSCGLIYNAAGTRGFTEAFYRGSYDLMMRNPAASIQSFAGPQPVSQAERSYQILREFVELPAAGMLLEVGAGKGEFLGYFTRDLPQWRIHALEPSNAFAVLQDRLPTATLERCDYDAVSLAADSVDVIVALGVLEHVENPLGMLRWGVRALRDGGTFFIRVPNFANNPNDLFCVDHLSKLTLSTLRYLAAAAGCEVAGVKEAGVPIFVALRKTGGAGGSSPERASENRATVEGNTRVARKSIEAVVAARNAARAAAENFAIFGLGSSGLFAPFFAGFDVAEIKAYIDENKSVWGSEIHGRPVAGLAAIRELGIKHIALAISPVYVKQVRAKLEPYGVTVYHA